MGRCHVFQNTVKTRQSIGIFFVLIIKSFPINGNVENPEVIGLKGLMDAYAEAQKYIGLSGPTLFKPFLEQAL